MSLKRKQSTKGSTSSSAGKSKEWQPTSREVYESLVQYIVTHSFKAVNTNIAAGGVRATGRFDRDFPYVTTRGSVQGLRFDQSANAALSRRIAQVLAVREGTLDVYGDSVVQDEVEFIRGSILPHLEEPQDGGDIALNPRFRQIFVQQPDGEDLLTTPLYAGALADQVSRKISAMMTARGRTMRTGQDTSAESPWVGCTAPFDTATLLIGGSNPANAGRFSVVESMKKPLIASAPAVLVGRKPQYAQHAFRFYYQGVGLRPRKEAFRRYIEWLGKQPKGESGRVLRNRVRVDVERRLVQAIAGGVLSAGKAAARKLTPLLEAGVIGELTSPNLTLAERGVIDESLRSRTWSEEAGDALASAMLANNACHGLYPVDHRILAEILTDRFKKEVVA